MKVPARLGLLLLFAAPVRAEELRQLYERHKAVARELDQVFKTIARERESFGHAPDPESHLARWAAHLADAKRLTDEQDELEETHLDRTHQGQALEISVAFSHALRGKKTLDVASSTLYEDTKRAEMMDDLSRSFQVRYEREFGTYLEASRTLGARRKAERLRLIAALTILGVAGAAVFFGTSFPGPRKAVILQPRSSTGPPTVPKLIAGNIAVKGLIGRGSMGEVYEGVDRTIGRRVALKRLRPELLASPDDLEGLLAEARIVASLKHDNLVSIHSVEREAGQVYLAFEFVDGVTLARTLEERRRFPWSEALRVFSGICAALDYAHAQRVVHRDLKPANILLARTGEVKVMDFGIAFTAQKSISRLTRAAAWGTPPYMAPEQELGGVSAAVDLFAASVCLYEMLTGELPFKGPNFLAQKREGLYTPASSLLPDLPPGVDAFFRSALAPEPSKRFPTAAALAAGAGSVR